MVDRRKLYLNQISNYLGDIGKTTNLTLSFYGGLGGITLFQSLRSCFTTDDINREADINLKRMLDVIMSSKDLYPTFCDGLAGIGWLLMYLHEIKYIDFKSESFFPECDRYLNNSLEYFIDNKNWDLLHGAVGIATYFLKRKKVKEVENVIDFLNREAIRLDTGIAWKKHFPHLKAEAFDFGLAHGNIGLLVFLMKCWKNNIKPEICKRLVDGGIQFYKNNIQRTNEQSFFPNFVVYNESSMERDFEHSRLAWCYGDLGILHSLFQISNNLGYHDLTSEFSEMLIETSKRRNKNDTMIVDFGLCHGSGGLSLMYSSLYHQTNIPDFQAAGQFWLDYTLSLIDIDSFKYSESPDSLKDKDCEYDFLDGLTGTAILLLDSIYHKEINKKGLGRWKECLFLI